MGENPYDDDMSPAMLERLQKLREDKRRRELEEERLKDMAIEYHMIQGAPCSGSNEFNALVWTIAKIIVYIALISYTTSVINGDYSLKQCNEVDGQCLMETTLKTCLPYTNSVCATICDQSGYRFDSDIGCIKDVGFPDKDASCIPSWAGECVDTSTCPSSRGSIMITSLQYVLGMLAIAIAVDFLYAAALALTKSLHISAFSRLSTFRKLVTVYIKLWAYVSQFYFLLAAISMGFLFYTYAAESASCSEAVTTSGAKYSLFDDSLYVGVAVLAAAIIILVVGTYFRARRPLRGQLYSASNDSDIIVPLNLDCKTCRDSSKPRWCRYCFGGHLSKESLVGCMCNCGSCIVDTTCCLTFELVGLGVEKCYKNRHFIGP